MRVAFTVLQARCSRVGLQVNTSKCSVYLRNHGAAQSVHSSTGVAHATRGLIVVGTPLGTKDFVRAHAQAKAEQAQCAVQKLLSLPLPAQCKFAVLQGSLQH